jgi:RNA polymerase sigma-70 factor (ECF subfamily)
MMKITHMQGDAAVARLQVEGWVTQHTVQELRASCETALTDHQTLLLDLSGVQFVDAAGVEVFHNLVARGATPTGCSGFLTELLQVHAGCERGAPEAEPADESVREAQLIARLRRGDHDAFEQLVRQYGGRLLATARRVLHNEDDARDAVQEAFLSAFRALPHFRADAKLSTWLHRIVMNTALMKLRSARRRPELRIEALLPVFDEAGEWAHEVKPLAMTSEDVLVSKETRARVSACIARLPASYREVVILRDIEELDTAEVAATLRISANAVKIRLHRARQALITLLTEAEKEQTV